MAGYYSGTGEWVEGATVGCAPRGGLGEVEAEITAAVSRCQAGGNAAEELRSLFRRYALLRAEGHWKPGEGPLRPLLDEYVRQVLDLR